jgi:hypothetical protein
MLTSMHINKTTTKLKETNKKIDGVDDYAKS